MEVTNANWRRIDIDGYPSKDDFGPYPTCFVALQTADDRPIRTIKLGELRFFGGDNSRPYWTDATKTDSHVPLENASWHVTHWAPALSAPDDWRD